jgi:hypothetical protein
VSWPQLVLSEPSNAACKVGWCAWCRFTITGPLSGAIAPAGAYTSCHALVIAAQATCATC